MIWGPIRENGLHPAGFSGRGFDFQRFIVNTMDVMNELNAKTIKLDANRAGRPETDGSSALTGVDTKRPVMRLVPARQGRQGPGNGIDRDRIKRAVREILLAIGEDPDRIGLTESPRRVARADQDCFARLRQGPTAQ
jgi:hypothetical protein